MRNERWHDADKSGVFSQQMLHLFARASTVARCGEGLA